MSIVRWNYRFKLCLLFLLDISIILVLHPAKGQANTPQSTVFPVSDTTIVADSEQLPRFFRNSNNSVMEQVTPISQLLSPIPQQLPTLKTSDRPLSHQMRSPDDNAAMGQVTSVSQLSDIKPTDWAFQALQSLVERYGVITGYPNQTFKGNRAMTRYEFAAGLNAALTRINELVSAGTSDLLKKEDLETLQKLQNQFAPELAQLRGRVDSLETRTATLQAQQFSTTTKLVGEVETVIGGVVTGNNVVTKQPAPHNFTFQDRVTLKLNTSFNGTDQLRIALSGGNITSLGGTRSGLLGTSDGKTSDNASPLFPNNELTVSGLRYRYLLGNNTAINVFAQSDGAFELGLSGTINPYFEGSAANGISRYSRRNMVYDYGDTGAGIAILHNFSKQLQLGLEYTAINPNSPTDNNGLFEGRYVTLGQLLYSSPKNNFRLALTYANTYSPPNTTGLSGTNFGPVIGSNLANSTVAGAGTLANTYGAEAFYRVTPSIALNGWVGYSAHRYLGQGDAEVWDWGAGLAFPDLFKKGNLGGIFVGMEPKLTSLSRNVNLGAGNGVADKDTSLHIEGFYQYQINDNIAITPGVIWITAPDFNAENPDSLVAWLRTTFRF
ncbi:iron uptake porin [Nostoc sp. KVJ3]|uniref:iron uptake porin n=1 Tax=Nostoc sp. KVJ3 TaxID=457945 RepID=UPI002236F5F8|nr:iron uptake porin [Nostoc sp. KVJ3]MCW5314954.1 iron uptake porin [Nostoc sp. KVJ3]